MMGSAPAACLAVRMISTISPRDSEKNSPVPPAANSAAAGKSASQATCSRYLPAWNSPAASKVVTGKDRSEERRVGKECVSTCRSRWSPSHEKTNHNITKLVKNPEQQQK